MSKVDTKILREAQLRMTKILLEIDRICKKNNIEYWISDGTFLGAVRHKGFIPWDDDIDVSMTVENYNKFVKCAARDLDFENFFLAVDTTQEYSPFFYARIRDRHSTVIEKEDAPNPNFHQGLFVDIFPMEFIKSIPRSQYKFLIGIRRKMIKEGKHVLGRKILSFFKIDILFEKLLIAKNENEAMFLGYKYKWNQLFKVKDVFLLKEIEFEGKIFPCPNNKDGYLKSLYGDTYMELPPEEEREWHCVEIKLNEKCEFEKRLRDK